MKIFFAVQGLFEQSDSIGYDCVYQYDLVRSYFGKNAEVRLFAERADPRRYPSAVIEPIDDLLPRLHDPELLLIYHFCDGWPDFEKHLDRAAARTIVRWHNNTPPWFFTPYSSHSVERTIAGFRTIQQLGSQGKCLFACNSEFTRRQLQVLGIKNRHLPVVYPATRYLDGGPRRAKRPDWEVLTGDGLSILFVGRVVAHKGHRHVLMIAHELQRISGKPVSVSFPGRIDRSWAGYVEQLRKMAANLKIDVSIPGEVNHDELESLYMNCSTFICMSEHEGFGLPVYEAMARDVPVAVWANTAFVEILEGHPLTFEVLDHSRIARAIHGLDSPVERSRVLTYQRQCVLGTYTSEIVRAQLLSALSAAASEFEFRGGDPAAGFFAFDVPTEIPDNFVTAYDLTSYSLLLAENAAKGMLGDWVAQNIPSDRFVCSDGLVRDRPFLCSGLTLERHIVFGPYVHLQPGSYRVRFYARLRTEEPQVGSGFMFDVCIDAGRVLASERVSSEELSSETACTPTLDFLVDGSDCKAEFRIGPYGFRSEGAGDFCFWGVQLLNLATSLQIEAGVEQAVAGEDLQSYQSAQTFGDLREQIIIDAQELYSIADDVDFLVACYDRVLGRAIDQDGLGHYLMKLRGDMSRADVLGNIVSSLEARRRNVVIGGPARFESSMQRQEDMMPDLWTEAGEDSGRLVGTDEE